MPTAGGVCLGEDSGEGNVKSGNTVIWCRKKENKVQQWWLLEGIERNKYSDDGV